MKTKRYYLILICMVLSPNILWAEADIELENFVQITSCAEQVNELETVEQKPATEMLDVLGSSSACNNTSKLLILLAKDQNNKNQEQYQSIKVNPDPLNLSKVRIKSLENKIIRYQLAQKVSEALQTQLEASSILAINAQEEILDGFLNGSEVNSSNAKTISSLKKGPKNLFFLINNLLISSAYAGNQEVIDKIGFWNALTLKRCTVMQRQNRKKFSNCIRGTLEDLFKNAAKDINKSC